MDRIERDLSGLSVPRILLKQGIPEHMAQNCNQTVLEYLHWDIHTDSRPSLGNLFQYTLTCTVKFFIIFRWNFPRISFCPLPLISLPGTTEQIEPGPSFDTYLQILTDIDKFPSQSFLLEAEQAQLPQPFLLREVLHLPSSLLLSTGSAPGAPHLSCAEESRIRHSTPDVPHQQHHQPQPAGSALPKASQDAESLLGHRALLALGQFIVCQDAQVLLHRAAYQQVR